MTDDLIPWLRAQLDARARLALAVKAETGPTWGAGDEVLGETVFTPDGSYILTGPYESALSWELRQYLVAHDPDHDLAEVDAKRRILDLHAEPHECPDWDHAVGETCTAYVGADECPTLRLLALPYADRPGYREEWRP